MSELQAEFEPDFE